MIIGITGTMASGKGTVTKYLEAEYGFKHLSVRNYLMKELIRRENSILREEDVKRDDMVELANELRSKYGPDFIVEELYKQALNYPNTVIESIRSVGEVLALREKPDFFLLATDAPLEIRYERARERNGITDSVSFEEFIGEEKREMDSEDINKQNLRECILLANEVIINDGGIQDLKEKVSIVLNLKKEYTNEFRKIS
jgi:dephospho-CoA kinase